MYAVHERLTLDLRTCGLKVRGQKKIFPGSRNQKRAEKMNFKSKTVTRYMEGHYMIIRFTKKT